MDWLFGNSEMAKLIRSKDWAQTNLGPINLWPESLKIAVNLCLNSNFPICIAWGKSHTQIYNDAYRLICGSKHPQSMGQDFKECWPEVLPIVGEIFDQSIHGKAAYLENQRVFIERFGYVEEGFFTFSYSPICGEKGEVLGIFHPVTETTEKMLGERREKILREFANRTSPAQNIDEVIQLAKECLSEHKPDLPFVLLYLFNENNVAELKCAIGLNEGEIAAPLTININEPNEWSINKISDEQAIEINDFDKRFGNIILKPYPEPIKNAILLPILSPIKKGILIAGINTRRKLDDNYRTFYVMLQTAMTLAITKAGAYAQEKKRAEGLEEIDRAKTVFFNNISHEFRTPLTLMLAPLEDILANPNLSSKLRPTLEIIYRNCLRLLKLVNTLLDFSRIEAQRMEAILEPVDLDSFTNDLASHFRPAIEQAQIQFNINCEKLKNPVYIDKNMWEKIVVNLLSNAFKYTLAGVITLTLQTSGNDIELIIADTGVGIPNAELPKIFDRFYRVKGIHGRTHEGTGIGLSLVQELVKLHNGSIDVTSTVGKGTTFTIKIPADKKDNRTKKSCGKNDAKYTKAFIQESLGLIDDTKNKIIKPVKVKKSQRIILAEDNADMRGYISNLLTDHYEVEVCANGKEALAAAINKPPNLILSDIMMPVMDGLELVKKLRETKQLNAIPIILLSARAGQEALIAGIDTGADDYLIKPFSAKELLARVKQHIMMQHLRQETTQQKNKFLSSITHDLRAPLNAIIGFTSLIHNEKVGTITSDQKEYLGHVLTSSSHLLQLINDLLDIAKFEAGKIEFKPEAVNLKKLIQEVVLIFQNMANEKNISLKFKKQCTFTTATLDPLRLKQILYNYLSNAIKFTPVNGLVTVKLVTDKTNMFRIDVKDSGIGIKSENINKLFVDFYQLHPSNDQKGTGLGLALTKRIVEAQNGKVEVKSKIGKGSTFSAILPRQVRQLEQN